MCDYNTNKPTFAYRNRRQISGSSNKWLREALVQKGFSLCANSVVCNKCRCVMNKQHTRKPLAQLNEAQESYIIIPLPNVAQSGKSKAVCVISRLPYEIGLTITIPSNARLDLLKRFSVFASDDSVICKTHLDRTNLKADVELVGSPRKKSTELQLDDASDLIENLMQVMTASRKRHYLDFLDPALTNEDFVTWTRWTKIQFDKMLDYLVPMGNTSNGNKISALAMFWIKIKTGLSFGQICTLLNLEPTKQLTCVATTIHSVSEQLAKYFVPEYLGVGSISRDEAMAHGTIYAETFFRGDRVITIWGGTYFYTQKSEDYEMARKTYSGHKNRPLLKFMSIVLPDGYVLDTIGPFMSDCRNNDAGMTQYIIEFYNTLTCWLQEDDVTVLDRGFRDVNETFEQLRIDCKMPAYLSKGLSQHPTGEANHSRLVTKVRWSVEAYHGRIKNGNFSTI